MPAAIQSLNTVCHSSAAALPALSASCLPLPAGWCSLAGGDSLWRIDSEELSAFISELISTAEQPLQIEVEAGGSIPQEVIDYAVDYTRAQIAYYGAAGCNIAEAKITGLTKIDIEAEAAEMYLLEYRLLPSEPGSVLPEDGTRIEDGLITERRSSGQPYLLFSNNGKEALKRVGVTNTSAIEGQYCTPEMLDRYGDMYTAAALELLRSWLAEPSWTEIYVAIKPTEVSKSGDDYTYIVPEAQDIWHSAWDEAMLSVEALSDADRAGLLGIQIIYHDSWWQLMENGSLTCYSGKISAENASELYDLALSAAKEAGWAGIVRPSDISNVVSATLDWYGAQQTATDPDILSQIETWLSSSEELYGGAACPFTALLTLELADGESLTVSMATDSCGVWTSEGVSYSYYGENADFYSMFSAALIHDAASEGIDSVLPLMPYIDWTRYYRAFDMDTFELMNMLRDWAAEDGLSDSERTSRYTSVMTWTRALDGGICGLLRLGAR